METDYYYFKKKLYLCIEDAKTTMIEIKDISGNVLTVVDAESLEFAQLNLMDLRGADLSGLDLSNADLSDSDLTGANLCGTDMQWADLGGAILEDIITDVDTILPAKTHRSFCC